MLGDRNDVACGFGWHEYQYYLPSGACQRAMNFCASEYFVMDEKLFQCIASQARELAEKLTSAHETTPSSREHFLCAHRLPSREGTWSVIDQLSSKLIFHT